MSPVKQHDMAWMEGMSSDLGIDLTFALNADEVAATDLSELEEHRARQFLVEKRREHWLRGRYALKQILAQLGLPLDTGNLVFPHPRLSLSHSDHCALAVGVTGTVRGLGVDLELNHGPRHEAAHLFLTDRELAAWRQVGIDQQAAVLRRLWCIKEAAFKANPKNATTALFDYELEDIYAPKGRITRSVNVDVTIEYVCDEQEIAQQKACVAVAVAR